MFLTQAIEGVRQADAETTAVLYSAGIRNHEAKAPGELVAQDVFCDFTKASDDLQRDVEYLWRRALREKGEDERALDCFDRIATEEGLAARFLWEAGARPESGEAFSEEQVRVIGEHYGFYSFLVGGCAALRTLVLCARYTGDAARNEPHIWTALAGDFYGLAINYQQYAIIEASMRYAMGLRRAGKSLRRYSGDVAVSPIHSAVGVTADTIRTAGVLSAVRARAIIGDLLILEGDDRASYIADLRQVLDDAEANIDAPAPMESSEVSAVSADESSSSSDDSSSEEEAEEEEDEAPAAARDVEAPAPAPAPPRPKRRVSIDAGAAPAAKKRRGAEPSPPRATGSPQRPMSPLKTDPAALAAWGKLRRRASGDNGVRYD